MKFTSLLLFAVQFLAMIVSTVALSEAGLAQEQAHSGKRPNVLLILTDDQGYGDFSLNGNPHLQTPHIDALGRNGVQFERFYVNSFCSPTRASLLTGRWSLRTGVHGVTHTKEAMNPAEITLAEMLKDAGYRTGCFGKWHNGEQYPFTAIGQGFEEFLGFNNGHWNSYFDSTLLRGSQSEATKGYISDVLTDEAIRFVTEHQREPFLCYLAFNAPHSPFQVADRYFDKFKSKGFDDDVAAFYGMCENIDDNVGRLLAILEQLQLAENTIVLFLTDNGGTAGVRLFNAGMRGGKTSLHEGGTRVPLLMRWPAAKWKPHVVKPLTAHIDIVPTLLDLCGVARPAARPLDGTSLRPLLEREDSSTWQARTLFTHNPIDLTNKFPGAVRTSKYRLVRENTGPAGGSKANDKAASAWQLYDMERDPGEITNIAVEHADIVKELSDQYDNWFADISRDGLQRFPLPIGYREQNPVELHAPQAYFDPPLKFAAGPGWANDWLTNWTDAKARVWFEIDIMREGTYQIELAYSCEKTDAGAKIQILVGDQSLQATVPPAEPVAVLLPHRDVEGHNRYRNRSWAKLDLGSLQLKPGRAKLVISPQSRSGVAVMDFKQVSLTLLK